MDTKPGNDFENDRLLDKLLKEDPGYLLPENFADHLIKMIRLQQSFKQYITEFLTILGAVIGIVVAFGGTCYFINEENFIEIKSMLFNNYTLVIALFVIFIFFMDRVLLKMLNQLK
jgi:hypothetical protein